MMLQVLRKVAIDRVRTAIPAFGQPDLDRLIMASGYPAAISPHSNTSDLFYVYAASITNAGGAKPNFVAFGALVKAGIGPFLTAGIITSIPSVQSLASACVPHLVPGALGGRFDADVRNIAAGKPARPLMMGLLSGVCAFACWLQRTYGGNAATFHGALAIPPPAMPSSVTFCVLRSLSSPRRRYGRSRRNFA